MRILLELEPLQQKIPIDYRLMFLSYIKEAVRIGSEDFYCELFEKQARAAKPFCFSVNPIIKSLTNKEIFTDKIFVTISTNDWNFFINLQNGLVSMNKVFTYKEFALKRSRFSLLPLETIRHNQLRITFKSPFFILKDGKVINPADVQFEAAFNDFAKMMYGIEGVSLKPLKIKKEVVKELTSHNNGQFLYYECFKGTYILSGQPKDLQVLYDQGLSLRKSQGYGLFEIEVIQ